MHKSHFFMIFSLAIFLGSGCQAQTEKDLKISSASISEETKITEAAKNQMETKKITVTPSREKYKEAQTIFYVSPWFDIKYPENFTARPISPVRISNETEYIQTDEAYFASPDGTVEFFVYSPLWSGEPDYLEISSSEELVSEKMEEIKEEDSPGQYGDKIIYWATIKAKDSSYYRSFMSVKEQVGTESELHHVFGIKYKNAEAYEKHKEAYIAFKTSLNQYAD